MVPHAIYEALPFCYIACGATAALGVDELLGRVCGVMLVTAGLAILKMRARYRKDIAINPITKSRYG